MPVGLLVPHYFFKGSQLLNFEKKKNSSSLLLKEKK